MRFRRGRSFRGRRGSRARRGGFRGRRMRRAGFRGRGLRLGHRM